MKKLVLSIAALFFFASNLEAQFRMVGTGSWSTVDDSTYTATVNFESDLTGMGYLATQIDSAFRVFTPTEQIYRIDSVYNKTFSSADLRVIEYSGDWGVPVGQVMCYNPDSKETVPQAPFGATGSTSQMQAAIDSYNARLIGSGSGTNTNIANANLTADASRTLDMATHSLTIDLTSHPGDSTAIRVLGPDGNIYGWLVSDGVGPLFFRTNNIYSTDSQPLVTYNEADLLTIGGIGDSVKIRGDRLFIDPLNLDTDNGIANALTIDPSTKELKLTSSGGTDDQTAAEVPITDAGGYYAGGDVEAGMQEIGVSINALTAGQTGGLKTFTTLADLQAYATPDTLDSYKVTNDPTFDNNAYYNWNGSAYVKDASILDQAFALRNAVGKNKLDSTEFITGFYINYINGNAEPLASFSRTDYIPLLPSTTYTLSNSTSNVAQFALYNASYARVAGYAASGSEYQFTTGATTVWGRFSINNTSNNNQLEIGDAATAFEPYELLIAVEDIEQGQITEAYFVDSLQTKLNTIVRKNAVGKNKIDTTNLTVGQYVDLTDGVLKTAAGFSATDFVPLSANTPYTLSSTSGGLQQFAMYDSNQTYVSGLDASGAGNEYQFTTGGTIAYGRFTLVNAAIGNQLEIGTDKTTHEAYETAIDVDEIEPGMISESHLTPALKRKINDTKIIVTVGADKDFTNLREALESISGASADRQYEVQIDQGTYNVFDDYTPAEINLAGFQGVRVNPYISLRGMGHRDSVILQGALADTFNTATMLRVSTIAKYGNGDLKNLTITAANLRYAVHDDYNYSNQVKTIENCKMINYGGVGGSSPAWGGGSREGDKFFFKNCRFYSEATGGAPFFHHNNTGFTKPMELHIDSCQFVSADGDIALRAMSLASTTEDILTISNSRFTGKIWVSEPTNYFTITGQGNDVTLVDMEDPTGYYNFEGEHLEIVNTGTALVRGDAVKRSSNNNGIEKMGASDGPELFYGVAMHSIDTDSIGVVRVGGFLAVSETTLSGLSVGDKIGITSGALAVVTGSEYIGTVISSEFIQLR